MYRARLIDPRGNVATTELDPARAYVIGRSPDSDIVVDDPAMSRRHARLSREDGSWTIRDAGSANGTRVGGRRIGGPVELAPGDRVLMGDSALEIEASPDVSFSEEPFERAGSTVLLAPDAGRGPEALRALEFIERANLELLAHEPIDVLLPKVVDLIFEAVKPERAALLVLDDEGRLECRVARGDTGAITISRTIASTVIGEKASILTANAEGDARFGGRASIAGLRAVMAVPMIDRNGVTGLIYADSRSRQQEFDENDLRLLTVLAKVAAIQIENARLFQFHLEEQRLERELRAAAAIQKRLLRGRPPAIAGYSVQGVSVPCRGVGGDYFGCVPVGPDRFVMGVADVAGKGMPAALLMAAFQATFVARAEAGNRLEQLVEGLNTALVEKAPDDRFVTLFAFELDSTAHRIRWVNAGHAPAPLIVRSDGSCEELSAGTLPLGIDSPLDLPAGEAELASGDAIFACSDGVTDATDSDGTRFGDARLRELLAGAAGQEAGTMVATVQTAVRDYAAGNELPDDVTMLALVRD